jgi:hypothetical protein
MIALSTIALFAVLKCLTLCRANPLVEGKNAPLASCIDYNIPVTITSENYIFNVSEFRNNFDVVNVITDFARKDSNTSFHPFHGTKNETAEYLIAGTFCTPNKPVGREKQVLLATPGIGYDRRYWDSKYKPKEYNFVRAMVAKGYSVFFYDRLGTGESQK